MDISKSNLLPAALKPNNMKFESKHSKRSTQIKISKIEIRTQIVLFNKSKLNKSF